MRSFSFFCHPLIHCDVRVALYHQISYVPPLHSLVLSFSTSLFIGTSLPPRLSHPGGRSTHRTPAGRLLFRSTSLSRRCDEETTRGRREIVQRFKKKSAKADERLSVTMPLKLFLPTPTQSVREDGDRNRRDYWTTRKQGRYAGRS